MKKDWVERELTVEVIVGVFMVVVLLGLASFTFVLSGKKWGQDKYTMNVLFKDVMGLREKDNVVARGMPIGEVSDLELDEDEGGVNVTLTLKKRLKMRLGYKITIVSTSILGGRYLEIYEGPEENDLIDIPCHQFIGQKPYDLMADAAELVNSVKGNFVEEGGVLDNFKKITLDMQEVTSRLNRGKGSLARLLSDDDKFYKDLEATMASIKIISERIEKGEGMVGRLIQDDDLYEELKQILEETRAAIDDFRETAPVVTFTSIFFGAF
ncbi:MlaD family protein [Verrucomicrobiota bacterium]